jgi:hypothetical protein
LIAVGFDKPARGFWKKPDGTGENGSRKALESEAKSPSKAGAYAFFGETEPER